MLLKLAWRNIWRNKGRTVITMMAVMIAVVLSILMMSAKEGVYAKMIESMILNMTGHAQIHQVDYVDEQMLDNSLSLSEDLVNDLNESGLIKGWAPRIQTGALVFKDSTSNTISKNAIVMGIDPDKEAEFISLKEHVTVGEFITNEDNQVMLGEGLAERLKVKVGDSIILVSGGYHGSQAYGLYNVKGLVKYGSPELSNGVVFMPIKEAQWMYSLDSMCTNINIILKDESVLEESVSELNNILSGKILVRDWKELNPELINMIETDRVEGYIFMFILYMVITFGLFGTMLMMLSERTREFGVLISIGMKRFKLASVVWMEMIIISILGVLVGIAVAFPICYYFHSNPIQFGDEQAEMMADYGMEAVLQFSIDPSIFLTQAMIIFSISSVLALFPFRKLLKLNPQEAMRV